MFIYFFVIQKFFLNGRLIFGPDASSLIVTLLLILVPVVLFCAFVARNLIHEFPSQNTGYAVFAVAVIFTIYVSSLISFSVASACFYYIGICCYNCLFHPL